MDVFLLFKKNVSLIDDNKIKRILKIMKYENFKNYKVLIYTIIEVPEKSADNTSKATNLIILHKIFFTSGSVAKD